MSATRETMSPVDQPSLLAAVFAVLRRYTDRSELIVGYVAHPGASLQPLALDVGGDLSFAELVTQVEAAIAAPGQNGHAAAEPDVVVSNGQSPDDAQHPPWLVVGGKSGDTMDLHVHRNGSAQLAGLAGVSGDLFVGHLRTLLAAAAQDSSTAISALAVLTDAERHRLLVEWNDTAMTYPRACLHELVQEQAKATPESVAVEFGDEQLTYAELDARANQLAHHLARMGVGPEVLVGICVERSIDTLVGLLGIMKAGGAYVPVDPEYPAERQAYMLTHSQAPVVITQERLRDRLPLGDVSVVLLDADWPTIATRPTNAPDIASDPEQLAYVIYTSGSTGKPKGVQIPHRALVNFLATMEQTPGLTADDVLVAVTTLSFDIAGLELYLPLVTGARVVLASAETSSDPRALASLLERSGARRCSRPHRRRGGFLLIPAGPREPGSKGCAAGRRFRPRLRTRS
jgi:non-ribosomal peptide synthetase component F